jgi:hypothetical protein
MYNGQIVEYDESEEEVVGANDKEAKKQLAERETVVNKEIYSFTQKSLDERGIFLLDFSSEAFIWVGKKVLDKDRLMVF